MSSFKCLSIVKRKLGLKKVGFLGTLDPLASGVLVLLCGHATKLADKLHGGSKVYRSVFTFGVETTTLDNEGEVVRSSDVIPSREGILEALKDLTGDIEIEVPKFSAVHVNGQRAYDLARRGVEFEAPKKSVRVDRFQLCDDLKYLDLCRIEPLGANEFYFEIECNAGTYVRSLAKLIAQRLGSVAIASSIIRTRVGEFDIESAKSLENVEINDILQECERF